MSPLLRNIPWFELKHKTRSRLYTETGFFIEIKSYRLLLKLELTAASAREHNRIWFKIIAE